MKNLLYAIMILSCFTSIYPYAFVHGSKSDLDEVSIVVYDPNKYQKRRYLALQSTDDEIAIHRDVKRGNKGRGAEWNSGDIEKQKGIKKGTELPFIIYRYNPYRAVYVEYYEGKIRSDGLFCFTFKQKEHYKNEMMHLYQYTIVPNDEEAKLEYEQSKK